MIFPHTSLRARVRAQPYTHTHRYTHSSSINYKEPETVYGFKQLMTRFLLYSFPPLRTSTHWRVLLLLHSAYQLKWFEAAWLKLHTYSINMREQRRTKVFIPLDQTSNVYAFGFGWMCDCTDCTHVVTESSFNSKQCNSYACRVMERCLLRQYLPRILRKKLSTLAQMHFRHSFYPRQ